MLKILGKIWDFDRYLKSWVLDLTSVFKLMFKIFQRLSTTKNEDLATPNPNWTTSEGPDKI